MAAFFLEEGEDIRGYKRIKEEGRGGRGEEEEERRKEERRKRRG